MNKFSIIRDGRPLINEDGTTKYYYDKEQAEAMVKLLKISSPDIVVEIKQLEDDTDFDEETFSESCNYCVLVTHKETKEVMHMCLYQDRPTDVDMEELKHEIATDEEFGLTDYKTEDFNWIVINKFEEGKYEYR